MQSGADLATFETQEDVDKFKEYVKGATTSELQLIDTYTLKRKI